MKICSYCETNEIEDNIRVCKDCNKKRWQCKKDGVPFRTLKMIRLEADRLRGLKTCTKCNKEFSFSEFERADGATRNVCNRCHADSQSDIRKKNQKLDPVGVMLKEKLNSAKKRAKTDGYDFNITIEDLYPLPTHCEVLGIELVYKSDKDNRVDGLASLDKIYPEKGYTVGNVKIISHKANVLKSDASIEQLEKILDYMRRHKG